MSGADAEAERFKKTLGLGGERFPESPGKNKPMEQIQRRRAAVREKRKQQSRPHQQRAWGSARVAHRPARMRPHEVPDAKRRAANRAAASACSRMTRSFGGLEAGAAESRLPQAAVSTNQRHNERQKPAQAQQRPPERRPPRKTHQLIYHSRTPIYCSLARKHPNI